MLVKVQVNIDGPKAIGADGQIDRVKLGALVIEAGAKLSTCQGELRTGAISHTLTDGSGGIVADVEVGRYERRTF
jgi:hypothetical protein